MKTLRQSHRAFLAIAALSITLLLAGAGQSFGDTVYYRHDNGGYWDGHNHYHHYAYYHNHRGYWDERNGVRIWITL